MKKVFSIFLLPLALFSQTNYTARIDSCMQAEIAINNFNGNVLIAQAGKIIYQKSFGFKNFYTKEKLDVNSVFELASISKQFTAVGILLLNKQGKLNLNDSLRKYFPQLPYTNITIKNLLIHTSGLPAYEEEMAAKWDKKNIASNNDVISFLAKEKPSVHFSPDKKWEYSNTAYVLLASIIEKISGQTYNDFMRSKIFEPLQMKYSRVYNTRRSTKEIIPNYAYGFVYNDSLKKYMLPDSLVAMDFVIYLDSISGDGTINSTTGDLLKWDRALKSHVLLNESLQKEMFAPQSTIDTLAKLYYGYGVMLGKNQFGDFISHDGGWPGYATILTRYPAKDITFIILSNNDTRCSAICNRLAAIMFNKPVAKPYIHKEVAIDTAVLQKYTGTYKGSTISLHIIAKQGKLYRHRENRPDLELKSESNTKFFYSDESDRQIEFEIGKTSKAVFINEGLKTNLTKVD